MCQVIHVYLTRGLQVEDENAAVMRPVLQGLLLQPPAAAADKEEDLPGRRKRLPAYTPEVVLRLPNLSEQLVRHGMDPGGLADNVK